MVEGGAGTQELLKMCSSQPKCRENAPLSGQRSKQEGGGGGRERERERGPREAATAAGSAAAVLLGKYSHTSSKLRR